MPITIVVGGQFGSEGKGKVAHYLAGKMGASFAVRCGGPNSGHTVIDKKGQARIFQQLPTAAILPDTKLAICAGSYVDLSILLKEIKSTGVDSRRLIIDREAVIITDEMKKKEVECGLVRRIGSTGSGTGAAVASRICREGGLVFAKSVSILAPFIQDVSDVLRDSLNKNDRIIIEGTQGFGLSPLHSRHYPYTTSRDTTAAGFLSETGLSPLDVDDVVLTIRSFPIRVGGESGPLVDEINWPTVTKEGNHIKPIEELTSVSRQTRRVARFAPAIVREAIKSNRPTKIVLNHLDYISNDFQEERNKIISFINLVEKQLGTEIDLFGIGPSIICTPLEIF